MIKQLEWVAGVVCVSGLVLAILALLGYALWDLYRQLMDGGQAVSVTASQWWARFFMRHPIAAFAAGLGLGILAGHFMWAQVVRVP